MRFVLALCVSLAATVMINALTIGHDRIASNGLVQQALEEGAAGVGPAPPKDIAAVIEASALGVEPAAVSASQTVAAAFGISANDPDFAKPFGDAGRLKAIRRQLRELSYKPGQAAAAADLETRAEILAYEHDSGLALTGEPSETVLKHMVLGGSADPAAKPVRPGQAVASRIADLIAKRLKLLGFGQGLTRTKLEPDIPAGLAQAIAAFETAYGLEKTGRISAPLVRQMAKALTRTVAAE